MKLLQGNQFLYLLRGMPRTLLADTAASAASWGTMRLVFTHRPDLLAFLAALRHVAVQQEALWPEEMAALWCRQDGGGADGRGAEWGDMWGCGRGCGWVRLLRVGQAAWWLGGGATLQWEIRCFCITLRCQNRVSIWPAQ